MNDFSWHEVIRDGFLLLLVAVIVIALCAVDPATVDNIR